MKVTLWGVRGSIATGGPETARYGGDTASVEVRADSGSVLILDAGSGIRPLGAALEEVQRIDILLSHLHMDHIQGLPFFGPMYNPAVEVNIWGPISTTKSLRERVTRYLSPPLFPVRVRELPNVRFHDVPPGSFDIESLHVTAELVCHPGATLGYRIEESGSALAYISDHEPALGSVDLLSTTDWVSGFQVAKGAAALIHDSQYTDEEYEERIGWGHTSYSQLLSFASMAGVETLVTFHHDPSHSDDMLDDIHEVLVGEANGLHIIPGKAGTAFEV